MEFQFVTDIRCYIRAEQSTEGPNQQAERRNQKPDDELDRRLLYRGNSNMSQENKPLHAMKIGHRVSRLNGEPLV